MEITDEEKKEYYDYEEQGQENCMKIKVENVRLPSGITLKRVGVETKIKDTNQEEINEATTPAVNYESLKFGSNDMLVKKDAADIVEKFKTVNSGLKISLTSVEKN